jgi:DNA-binding response OmpR family regulator
MPADRALRILVVDDHAGVRQLIVRALQDEGYEVVAVRDGQAGLDAATSANLTYDLVVTNSYMPHLSGEQLIGELHRMYPGLPILHIDDLSHPQGPNASHTPTLYKPFSIDTLLERVQSLLPRRVAR